MSKNGLSLYFSSNRPRPDGSDGGVDIWVSQRASVDDPWGPPENLSIIIHTGDFNTKDSTRALPPCLAISIGCSSTATVGGSEYGHLGFVARACSRRLRLAGTSKPRRGCHSPQFEAGASYFENEEGGLPLLFLGKGPTANTSDIYVSELQPDGSFGEAVLVEELSSSARPINARRSASTGSSYSLAGTFLPGNFDLMVSTRKTVFDAWELQRISAPRSTVPLTTRSLISPRTVGHCSSRRSVQMVAAAQIYT